MPFPFICSASRHDPRLTQPWNKACGEAPSKRLFRVVMATGSSLEQTVGPTETLPGQSQMLRTVSLGFNVSALLKARRRDLRNSITSHAGLASPSFFAIAHLGFSTSSIVVTSFPLTFVVVCFLTRYDPYSPQEGDECSMHQLK